MRPISTCTCAIRSGVTDPDATAFAFEGARAKTFPPREKLSDTTFPITPEKGFAARIYILSACAAPHQVKACACVLLGSTTGLIGRYKRETTGQVQRTHGLEKGDVRLLRVGSPVTITKG